jgi:hypothetical protein
MGSSGKGSVSIPNDYRWKSGAWAWETSVFGPSTLRQAQLDLYGRARLLPSRQSATHYRKPHHWERTDILRLARPTPVDNERRALFGWLTGKDVAQSGPATEAGLPELVRNLTAYRQSETVNAQVAILSHLPARWDLLAAGIVCPP